MRKGLLFILVCMVCGALLTSCAKPKYAHKDPLFSYEYPGGYKAGKLHGKNEVARFSNPKKGSYNLPVYTASVADKSKGLTLERSPDVVLKNLQSDYPEASRFKMLEKKRVKLDNGSDALVMKFKWRWTNKVTYLQTASVIVFKEDKMIIISGTTAFGFTPLEELMKQCMTLNLQP